MAPLSVCSVWHCRQKARVSYLHFTGCAGSCGWHPCAYHSDKGEVIEAGTSTFACCKCGLSPNTLDEASPTLYTKVQSDILKNKAKIERAALALHPSARSVEFKSNFHIPGDGTGNSNIHAEVHFDTGDIWLVRVKCRLRFMPYPHHVAESEVATMKALHAAAPKLVPQAWLPEKKISNLPLNFIERWPGRPHEGHYVINSYATTETDLPPFPSTVIKDYAAALIQITSVSFDGIGSLTSKAIGGLEPNRDTKGSSVLRRKGVDVGVGPMAITDARFVAGGDAAAGPFRTLTEYVTKKADILLSLLSQGAFLVHDPLHTYLSLLELKEIVNACEEFCKPQPTYITHLDGYGDHLLVAADGHLGGIVDWECAMTLPLPLAVRADWLTAETLCSQPHPGFAGTFTAEEHLLRSELIALGRQDLAAAFDKSQMYDLAFSAFYGIRTPHVAASDLIKLAELTGLSKRQQYASSPDEWLAFTLARHREDQGLIAFMDRYGADAGQYGADRPPEWISAFHSHIRSAALPWRHRRRFHDKYAAMNNRIVLGASPPGVKASSWWQAVKNSWPDSLTPSGIWPTGGRLWPW